MKFWTAPRLWGFPREPFSSCDIGWSHQWVKSSKEWMVYTSLLDAYNNIHDAIKFLVGTGRTISDDFSIQT